MRWPPLTVKNVAKYYPETAETPKRHMYQTQKNVSSTKTKSNPSKDGKKKRINTTTTADVIGHEDSTR